jgi:hypothetical protein
MPCNQLVAIEVSARGKIFSALQRAGVNRFNLLTTLEKDHF